MSCCNRRIFRKSNNSSSFNERRLPPVKSKGIQCPRCNTTMEKSEQQVIINQNLLNKFICQSCGEKKFFK